MKILLSILSIFIFHTLGFCQALPSYVPSSGLVAWYSFSNSANDLSGNGNHGTVNGASPSADRFNTSNSAYSFDGVNDYIEIEYDTQLQYVDVDTFISISTWFYMDGGGCNPRILEMHDSTNCGGYSISTKGSSNSKRTLHTGQFGPCGDSLVSLPTDSIEAKKWHHLVFTANGSSGVVKYYLDGILIHSDTSSNRANQLNYYNNPSLFIGNISPARCDWWGGKIDDLGIWSRILTGSEVSTLYSSCHFTTFSTDTITSCGPYTWTDGITYTSSNNTATYTFVNAAGCDSIVTLSLKIRNNWNQIGSDIDGEAAGDNSGYSVSLSSDGSTVAIGAPYNDGNGTDAGHVRIYKNVSGTWTQQGSDIDGDTAGDASGWSVSLSSDGSIVAIGDSNGSDAGHVRIYKDSSGTWTQLGSDIDVGSEVSVSSLSSDGSTVAIGASRQWIKCWTCTDI